LGVKFIRKIAGFFGFDRASHLPAIVDILCYKMLKMVVFPLHKNRNALKLFYHAKRT
jgi:hypothetical protein